MPSPHELSSAKSDWRTPPYIFEWLDREFHFEVDAAASYENALCPFYYSLEHPTQNALTRDWRSPSFANPPYSRVGHLFLQKAWQQCRENSVMSVLLIPPSTGTIAWHTYASRAAEIRFLRPRIAFLDDSGRPIPNNTRDSCLVIFKPNYRGDSPKLSFVDLPQSQRRAA